MLADHDEAGQPALVEGTHRDWLASQSLQLYPAQELGVVLGKFDHTRSRLDDLTAPPLHS